MYDYHYFCKLLNMLTNLDALVFAKFFTLVISFKMDLNFSSALLQKHWPLFWKLKATELYNDCGGAG